MASSRASGTRRLDEDDVTGIAEDARDEIKGHLRSGRHNHVIGMRVDAHLAHDVEDLAAQRDVALAGAVLQHFGPALAHEARGSLRESIEGERLHEGHAPGQRDDLRSRGDSEEGADLRGGHPAGARGVGIHPRIEP
jgi:hypothetical protein